MLINIIFKIYQIDNSLNTIKSNQKWTKTLSFPHANTKINKLKILKVTHMHKLISIIFYPKAKYIYLQAISVVLWGIAKVKPFSPWIYF